MRALGIYKSLHGKLSWIPRDNGASFLSDGTEVELESRESRVSFLRQTDFFPPETRKDTSLFLKDQLGKILPSIGQA